MAGLIAVRLFVDCAVCLAENDLGKKGALRVSVANAFGFVDFIFGRVSQVFSSIWKGSICAAGHGFERFIGFCWWRRRRLGKRRLQPSGHSDVFEAYLALCSSGAGLRRSRSLSQITPVFNSNLVHSDFSSLRSPSASLSARSFHVNTNAMIITSQLDRGDSQNSYPISRDGGNTRENCQLRCTIGVSDNGTSASRQGRNMQGPHIRIVIWETVIGVAIIVGLLFDKMSRDVITVGSTMWIPLLYRGEYSQWRERFMNYLEEQTDGEAMINSIQNGDQPLPVIAQVSLAGNAHNAPHTLKDLKFWTAEEKKTRKIDHRKAAILYEYETFKAIKGEQLLDTYLCYLQVINDLKKCGYKKNNCELNYKFLNNLQQEWKQYATLTRQTKNLMEINIDALYNILNQNQGDMNDALGYKKKAIVITSDPLALVAEKMKMSKRKEKVVFSSDSKGSGVDDFSELKKITALLVNAFNRRKFYSKPTNNNLRTSSTSQSANKKQEFVKSDEKKVEKKDDEKNRDISKVKCYNCKKEGHFAKDCKKAKVKDYNYYKTKMLLAKKESDEQVLLAEEQVLQCKHGLHGTN
nr:hypothetical protein [Tanacetum cinerariifolium]